MILAVIAEQRPLFCLLFPVLDQGVRGEFQQRYSASLAVLGRLELQPGVGCSPPACGAAAASANRIAAGANAKRASASGCNSTARTTAGSKVAVPQAV